MTSGFVPDDRSVGESELLEGTSFCEPLSFKNVYLGADATADLHQQLRTDHAQLTRALNDLRAGKPAHLSFAEKVQLADQIKLRLAEIRASISELENDAGA